MITIRRLNAGDGMLYREARLASLKESPEAFSSTYAAAISRSEQSWHEQADSSAKGIDRATFIAIDDEPVGLATVYRDEKEPDVGELIQMWVAPEQRGSSLAWDLLEALTQWAVSNGFSRIKAEVVEKNSRALRFYEKCGFVLSVDSATHSGASVMLTKSLAQVSASPTTIPIVESVKNNHYDESAPLFQKTTRRESQMIRLATIEDALRIAEIHVDSWRVTYRGILPDEYLDALDVERREEAWKELCYNKNAPVYVVCGRQRVIGFCHISASRDRDSEGTAEINSIYMDPAELRRGYGRELLSAAFSFALRQGFRDVTLWVLNENKVAREFYEAMGFMPDGATKTEYGSGFQCNEIRYRRDLTNG